MATGGESDDTENETSIDVAGFMRAFDADDDNTGNISMFCKACLHPYNGEQKSGTIVLRCERCGQTDTILEQEVGTLDPQAWIGNLMMNRFMQVSCTPLQCYNMTSTSVLLRFNDVLV